jgi:hypothetical protein
MGLIRWFRSAWADAKKSGEWMTETPWPDGRPLSRRERWVFRTQPRSDMLFALGITATLVLVTIFLLVIVLIDALT